MELEKLESLALAVQDWSLTRAWLDPEDEGVSHVGGDTGDDDPLLVMTLDTGDYFQPQDALPLASFYAAVSPQAVLDLIAQIKDLEKRLALQTRVVESYEAQAEDTEAPSADQVLDEERKAVDLEARFTAQHQFLRWNRELQTPLVARAFEYAAFGKAVDLYQANLHKIAPLCPVSTEDLLHAIWVLMGECESKADNEDDRLLKHQVEGFYRMYGKATGTSLKPRWIERSEAASTKEAALRATLLERTPTEFQAYMAKYLNEGATVTVSPQNEDPSIGKYAICVKDTGWPMTGTATLPCNMVPSLNGSRRAMCARPRHRVRRSSISRARICTRFHARWADPSPAVLLCTWSSKPTESVKRTTRFCSTTPCPSR